MISSHALNYLQSSLRTYAHKQFFGYVCFVNNKLKITLTPFFNVVALPEIQPSTSQITTVLIRCGNDRHRPRPVILIPENYIPDQLDFHVLNRLFRNFLQPTNTNFIISSKSPNYFITQTKLNNYISH